MTETGTLEERGNGSQMITGCPKGDQHVCDEEGPFLSKCLKMGVVDCQCTWLAHTMALVLAQHCGHQKQIICFKKKITLSWPPTTYHTCVLFQNTCFWLPETDFLHRMWLHALKEVKSEAPICTGENVTLCYWHLILGMSSLLPHHQKLIFTILP